MTIDFTENKIDDLPVRVRAIMGVPDLILLDDVISSSDFLIRANKYINKIIKEYEDLDISLLEIAAIYYICYLICPGMYARLPKQMENTSTKTILQSINWDTMAIEMLGKCNEILDDAISEVNDDIDYSVSFAVLTSSSEYPNDTI